MTDHHDGLLPGPTARGLTIGTYVAVTPAAAILIGAGLLLLTSGFRYGFSDAPILSYTLLVAFAASICVAVVLSKLAQRRLGAEMARGYVTMPYDYREYDLRDPRDGRVLRARGEPGGSRILSVSLAPWRAAPRGPDHSDGS